MVTPLTEAAEKDLREYVQTLEKAIQRKAFLEGEIERLDALIKKQDGRGYGHTRMWNLEHHCTELRTLDQWLKRVALIRREILLHQQLDKLEGLGLSYPEIPRAGT